MARGQYYQFKLRCHRIYRIMLKQIQVSFKKIYVKLKIVHLPHQKTVYVYLVKLDL